MGTVKRSVLFLVVILYCTTGWSQVNRYVVLFKDKTGTPYSISNPSQFLGPKAIARRTKQGITVTSTDLPVVPGYVDQVRTSGAEILYTTRWLNGALVECDASNLPTLQSLAFVDTILFVAPNEKPSAGGRHKGSSRRTNDTEEIADKFQLEMLGMDYMHTAGYRGQNMTIAVFDDGFLGVNSAGPFQHLFDKGSINLTSSYDFVHHQSDVFLFDDHGTEVFSVIAAYQQGVYEGGAYDANFVLFVTEDVATEYRIEEYNWLFAAERADSLGVDIISTSLGYNTFDDSSMDYQKSEMDGKTTVIAKAAKLAAERGMVVVVSAGNEGAKPWKIVTTPADVKEVLSVGAVTSSGEKSNGSSVGPTADGRIKPDVVALGVATSTIKSNGTTGFNSGTSLASPLVTSLVAGIWQRYPELTNFEVMDLIRESASQAANPDNLLGYGIPNFRAAVNLKEYRPQDIPFAVYPNPVEGTLNIRVDNPEDVSTCRIEIVSVSGQLVVDYTISFDWLNRVYSASTTDVPAGVYILRIRDGANLFTYKIVKL